jgi:hypothetical protein
LPEYRSLSRTLFGSTACNLLQQAIFDAAGDFLGRRRQRQQSRAPACFLKLLRAHGARL